ncbi:MAG TPA: DUF6152 family protein [Gammaproteobacteria bacterium]
MSPRSFLVLLCGGVLWAAVPASAHHSFAAQYDRDRPITVTGKVAKLEWTNPHARLYVDAVDENGETLHWDFELGPPNNLMRLGWRCDSLVPGMPITVEGFLSRTEEFVANARTVKLADGREVFAGSAFDTTTPEE